MKAVFMTATGGPEVLSLQEVGDPQIEKPTQLKVRLKAAGVNPIDTKLRRRGVFYPDALPSVLGCDGAGVVEEIGAGVTRYQPGDAVWFCHGGLGGEQGNYAQYTIVDEAIARPKPESLDFIQAAAAPLVLITAWESLHERAGIERNQAVLIHAGAGGVGHVAIQLAKLAGARVCTTVSSREKGEFAREYGADEPIFYQEQDFVEAVFNWTDAKGADIALDTVGGETFRHTLNAMAHYGSLVTLLDPGTDVVWKEARNRNLRIGFELMLTPMLYNLPEARAHQGEILDRCGRWFDEGRLRIHVDRILPLAQAADAHRLIEEGHSRGKIVLNCDP